MAGFFFPTCDTRGLALALTLSPLLSPSVSRLHRSRLWCTEALPMRKRWIARLTPVNGLGKSPNRAPALCATIQIACASEKVAT